jgi:hypothetical protein
MLLVRETPAPELDTARELRTLGMTGKFLVYTYPDGDMLRLTVDIERMCRLTISAGSSRPRLQAVYTTVLDAEEDEGVVEPATDPAGSGEAPQAA